MSDSQSKRMKHSNPDWAKKKTMQASILESQLQVLGNESSCGQVNCVNSPQDCVHKPALCIGVRNLNEKLQNKNALSAPSGV